MALPTVDETARFVLDTLRSESDPNGTGAFDDHPGSDNAALASVLTKVATKQYAYAADRKRASIGATSSGSDLDDHVRDVYQDQRQGATAAVGTVYLQRLVGPLAATQIDEGSRVGTKSTDASNAVEYEAAQTVPVGAGVTAVAVPIRCLQAGAVGNVDLVSITEILDPLSDSNFALYVPIGGDPVLAGAAAPDVVGGGNDEETDDQVKARVFARPSRATPGTKAGVYKGATDVPGIASAVPVEIGDGTGVVYAGDINDQLPSEKQLEIRTNLEDWRPWGVPAAVRPYARIKVQVTASIHMQQTLNNYNRDTLRANAIAAVKRYFTTERKRLDEYFVNAIQTAIGKSNNETQTVVLSLPAADQLRPADSSYGTVLALNRYYVDDTSIDVQFFDPLTS